jgi:hypothetical protein
MSAGDGAPVGYRLLITRALRTTSKPQSKQLQEAWIAFRCARGGLAKVRCMAERKSYGVRHLLSVPTYGPRRRTIPAINKGMTCLGTPLPDDAGWAFVIILPDGRHAVGEARLQGNAIVHACAQLDVDPAAIMGQANAERAIARSARSE